MCISSETIMHTLRPSSPFGQSLNQLAPHEVITSLCAAEPQGPTAPTQLDGHLSLNLSQASLLTLPIALSNYHPSDSSIQYVTIRMENPQPLRKPI